MLKIITTLTLFLVGILAKGQEVENRTISSFSKVSVQNGIELVYTESDKPALRIEAPDRTLMNQIETKIVGNILTIRFIDANTLDYSGARISVHLAGSGLEEIKASDNAQVSVTEAINSKNLKISLRSGAKFNGTIKATGQVKLNASDNATFNGKIESDHLIANLGDRAKFNLTGKTEKANFKTANAALLLARNFSSNAIDINASGKSKATLNVINQLSVNITDEANVTYIGFPDHVNLNEEAVAFQKYHCANALTIN